MVVLVVVMVFAGAVGAVAYATRRTRGDVEPTVRQFAEFREAISHQVDGLNGDTTATARHVHGGPVTGGDRPRGAGDPSVQR
jgi:hypothetical protein